MGELEVWTHDRLKAKTWSGQSVTWFEPKYDGHRITIFKQRNGTVNCYRRKVGPHLELAPRLKYLEDFRSAVHLLPPYSSMDCELHWPGEPASSTITRVNDQAPLVLTPFAIPYFGGQYIPKKHIGEIHDLLKSGGLTPPPLFTYRKHTVDQISAMATEQKWEGMMMKLWQYEGWYKFKLEHTIDAVVTGLQAGRGKYAGQVGALLCSVHKGNKMVEIASVSGMDDDERLLIGRKDLGRVVELKYQEVAALGRLRHPRFIRWRDDKPAEECTFDQLVPESVEDVG